MVTTEKWNIHMETPMGGRDALLTLEIGDAVSGTLATLSGSGAVPIHDGHREGPQLSWKTAISQPAPMVLEFSTRIENDGLTGKVVFGTFGNGDVTGTRVA